MIYCLIDTNVLLNYLDVPTKNQNKAVVSEQFKKYVSKGVKFIIPFVVILETGNIISQNGDGNTRRDIAKKFVALIEASFNSDAPFVVSDFEIKKEWQEWLNDFVDKASHNKPTKRPNGKFEGTSLADLSIMKELERLKEFHKKTRSKVYVWSNDIDFSAYAIDIDELA